ncbi:MAG: hypothetical protein IID37_12535 [Planctomycetes bacterium]|nr:hypothetical protein [Planctomycetota bacterium]
MSADAEPLSQPGRPGQHPPGGVDVCHLPDSSRVAALRSRLDVVEPTIPIQIAPAIDNLAQAEDLVRGNTLGGPVKLSFVTTKLDQVYADNLYAYARDGERMIALAATGKRTIRTMNGGLVRVCYGHSAHIDQTYRRRFVRRGSTRRVRPLRARTLWNRLFPEAIRRFDASLVYFQIADENQASIGLARAVARALAADPPRPSGASAELKLVGRLAFVPVIAVQRPELPPGWRVERAGPRADDVLKRLLAQYHRHRMVDLPESFNAERYYVLVDRDGELRAGAQVAHPLRFRVERIPAWLECLVDLARSIGCLELSDRCVDVCLFHHLLVPSVDGSAGTHALRSPGPAGHHLRTLLAWLKVEHGLSGFGGVLIDPACPVFRLLVHSSWLLRILHAFGLLDRHAVGMWSICLDPSLDEELHDLSQPLFSSPLDS